MKIDDPLILKLEELAKLRLTDSERQQIKKDLGKIFAMFEKLKEVNTDHVEPFVHFNRLKDVRHDSVGTHVSNDEALSNASTDQNPFFTVPKIIE